MLDLPQLTIIRDEVAEVRLVEQIKAWILKGNERRLEGVHASDLLDPLYAYWQWARPKDITQRQVMFFMIGKVLHSFVLATDTPDINESDVGTGEEMGILFSLDAERDGHPVELKTSRTQTEPRPDTIQAAYTQYLEQLSVYMILKNCLVGELWILHISLKDASGKTFPEPRCYRVEITEKQFYELEQTILATRDALLKAREARNPSRLPLCRAWRCGKDVCAWWNDCKPYGRFDLPKKKWTA